MLKAPTVMARSFPLGSPLGQLAAATKPGFKVSADKSFALSPAEPISGAQPFARQPVPNRSRKAPAGEGRCSGNLPVGKGWSAGLRRAGEIARRAAGADGRGAASRPLYMHLRQRRFGSRIPRCRHRPDIPLGSSRSIQERRVVV